MLNLTLNTATGIETGTRYYTVGGTVIAARTGVDIQYLIPDRQGTDQLAVDASSYAVTRRQYLPFGQTRGAAPANWPIDKGYVDGMPDDSTGLEDLGAREYDPSTGRFLTADPVFESTDPAQMGGYDYAGNDPTTGSDSTGKCAVDDNPVTGRPMCAPACELSGKCAGPPDAPITSSVGAAGGGGAPTNDAPPGQGGGRNYSTWHNRVAEDAIEIIQAQAAQLGYKVLNVSTNLAVAHASKNCTEDDRELCRTGFADIVVEVLAPNGGTIQYVWEVKKSSIGEETANQEAVAYADQMNGNALKNGTPPNAAPGWPIGGPYIGAASGPQTTYWGSIPGSVVYRNNTKQKTKDQINRETDLGNIGFGFDASEKPWVDYQAAPAPQPPPPAGNSGGGDGSCFFCVPIAPPIPVPIPIPIPA